MWSERVSHRVTVQVVASLWVKLPIFYLRHPVLAFSSKKKPMQSQPVRPRLHSFLSARGRHAQKNAEDVTRWGCGGESFSPLLFPVLSRVHSRLPLLKTCVNFALCYLCITVCCVTESVPFFLASDVTSLFPSDSSYFIMKA